MLTQITTVPDMHHWHFKDTVDLISTNVSLRAVAAVSENIENIQTRSLWLSFSQALCCLKYSSIQSIQTPI